MNYIKLGIIVIILILIIVILIVLISLLNKKELAKTTIKKEYNIDISLPSSIGLFLPPSIEEIGKKEIHNIVKKIFSSYKFFNYQNMSLDELDKKEWHTWQVSLLLMSFKYNAELFIPNQEDVFHPFLLNSTQNDIKNLMHSLLKKYKSHVHINFSKDKLSKEYIWSTKEISVLFYFLANYKNYKK